MGKDKQLELLYDLAEAMNIQKTLNNELTNQVLAVISILMSKGIISSEELDKEIKRIKEFVNKED